MINKYYLSTRWEFNKYNNLANTFIEIQALVMTRNYMQFIDLEYFDTIFIPLTTYNSNVYKC